MLVPRKRCPKCHATFEGEGVDELFSCDQCGCGYLSPMEPREVEPKSDLPLPRGGAHISITHTRENF